MNLVANKSYEIDDLFPNFLTLFYGKRVSLLQRRGLLRMIAVAAEEGLKLAPLLAAWASDHRGWQRLRLKQLSKALSEGVPLPDAIERFPSLLSDDEILLVRYGSESGMLATSIREHLIKTVVDSENQRFLEKAVRYAMFVIVIGLSVLAFVQMAFVPALGQILDEFDIPKTPAIEFYLHSRAWILTYGWPIFVMPLIYLLFRSSNSLRRFFHRSIAPYLFGPLRRWRAADLLEKLGQSVQLGRPLAGSIATLAKHHFDPTLRHKLLYIRNEIELGEPIWQSLASTRLINDSDLSALKIAEQLGNSSWLLKTLSRTKQQRIKQRLAVVISLAVPAITLLLGSIVLIHSLALLLPLIDLLDSLQRLTIS